MAGHQDLQGPDGGTWSACACSQGECARMHIACDLGAWAADTDDDACMQVAENVKPTLVIFTMDGSIGQAAFDQAKAFKDSVEVSPISALCRQKCTYSCLLMSA